MKQVNVSNDGQTTIKFVLADVPIPTAKRMRDAAVAKYPFNEMKLGQCIFATDKQMAAAMVQAFKSNIYAPAQAIGRLSMRDLDKYPDIKRMHGQPDGAYGLWMVPNKEKAEAEKA